MLNQKLEVERSGGSCQPGHSLPCTHLVPHREQPNHVNGEFIESGGPEPMSLRANKKHHVDPICSGVSKVCKLWEKFVDVKVTRGVKVQA